MSYRSTPSELRDYASYLVELHSEQAPAKVAERLSTLESAGLLAGTVDWKVIGDEIAALLEPDPTYLTH